MTSGDPSAPGPSDPNATSAVPPAYSPPPPTGPPMAPTPWAAPPPASWPPAAPVPYYQPYPNPGSWEAAQYAPRPGIPGVAVAGTIVGFLLSIFLLVVGFFLILGAGFVRSLPTDGGETDSSGALSLLLAGLGNWVVAILLVVGGIVLLLRRSIGRVLIVAGAALNTALAVYWIFVFPDQFVIVWAAVLAAVGIIAATMSSIGGVSAWLATPRTPAAGPAPYPLDQYGRPFGS